MAKPSRSKPSRLAAEEHLLEKQREDLLRKQQELEKKLVRLPAVLEAQEELKRQQARQRAAAARPPISDSRRMRRNKGPSRTFRTPSRQRNNAKIWTLILLAVLAIIGFMLWNIIPTS